MITIYPDRIALGVWRSAVRRICCDHYEFAPPDSEQALDLAIAAPSRHCPDLAALLAACGASARE
jgi:hypothetical protein